MAPATVVEDESQSEWYITTDPNSEQDVHAEPVKMYRPGGFHPVHLGDHLGPDGRYRVADKLGHGGWGTVWLCHDEIKRRWRAVKIHAAQVSMAEKDRELGAAKELSESLHLGAVEGPQQILKSHGVALPINHFVIHGPNGTHLALVYPLLGTNIDEVFLHNAPHPELLKDICFQLVQTMHFLHRNRLCHGDFRPVNILFKLAEGVDQWSEEQLVGVLGKPKTEPLVMASRANLEIKPAEPNPARPKYLVSRNYFDYTSGVLSTSVVVADFGVSFPTDNPPKDSHIPGHWASPEEIIMGTAPLGFASDVWALMNTLVHVRLGGRGMASQVGACEVLEACEFVLGPMPQNYRSAWKKIGEPFPNGAEDDLSIPVVVNKEWYPRYCTGVRDDRLMVDLESRCYTLLDKKLWHAIAIQDYKSTGLLPRLPYKSENTILSRNAGYRLKDTVELGQLYDLCRSVYKWQPEERALTGEILNHPWFGSRNDNYVDKEIDNNRETCKSKWPDHDTGIDREKGAALEPGVTAIESLGDFTEEVENDQEPSKADQFYQDTGAARYEEDEEEEICYDYYEDDDGVHFYYRDDDGIHWCNEDGEEVEWDAAPF